MKTNHRYAIQCHSRSPILLPFDSLCVTFCVNGTNLHSFLHRLLVIADYWSNLCFWRVVPVYNTVVWGEPQYSRLWNLAPWN